MKKEKVVKNKKQNGIVHDHGSVFTQLVDITHVCGLKQEKEKSAKR